MSGVPPDGKGDAASSPASDREIAGLIATAVHAPFGELWQRYAKDAWTGVRGALRRGIPAHEQALDELAGALARETAVAAEAGLETAGPEGGAERAGRLAQAAARYRRRVAAEVLDPLRAATRDPDHAAGLESELAETANRVAGALDGLPALVRVPVSASALERRDGTGLWLGVKRECARALRPLVWRREFHEVAVAGVARGHLGRVVLPAQRRAFRESQRMRARWLGGLERAWSEWLSAVLGPPEEGDAGGETLLRCARTLDRRLRALTEGGQSPWSRSAGMDAARTEGILLANVAVAGTFVANDDTPDTTPRRDEELAAEWDRWASESAARLDLCRVLLEVRGGVEAIHRELTSRWGAAVQEIDAGLSEIEKRLEAGRARADRLAGRVGGIAETLQRDEARTVDDISRVEDTLPQPPRLLEMLNDRAESALHRFREVAERLPEELVVHRVPRPDAQMRRPGGEGYAVELREAGLQAFDALRAQRIRAAPATVSEAMEQVRAMVAELREVAAYGYEAAIAEISEAADPASVDPTVMVADGLARAAGKVEEARGVIFAALAAAETAAGREVGQGMEHLFQRATADRLTGRYLDARSHVVAEAARDQERWRGRLSLAASRVSGVLRVLRSRLWPVRRALGIGEDIRSRVELRDRTLAFAKEIPAGLPVVYRRLFSFEPLTDPRLLAGRDDALDTLESAWARWRSERTRSLMVIAPTGSGATSFLNIAAERLSGEDSRTVRRTLRERLRTEAALAARLGRWLGIDGAAELDRLAQRILEAPPGSLPRQVIVEGAEHIHLRVPGGASLLRRLLAFTTRTQPRIFWVLSMSSSAWQLAEKRCPASLADIEQVPLRGLRATELRQAVLARHRLSGLPLHYLEPRTGRNLLRTRRRGLRGSQKHQQLIETDYFQKLHRASLGSIRLALFHWLRSADFGTVEGSLRVRPLEPLEPFAGPLDIDQSFALKAILDHGTLTVDEYSEVVRVPVPRSRHMFHALSDLRVIETAAAGAPAGSDGSGARYRVRPLVNGAVVAHLKSLNIAH